MIDGLPNSLPSSLGPPGVPSSLRKKVLVFRNLLFRGSVPLFLLFFPQTRPLLFLSAYSSEDFRIRQEFPFTPAGNVLEVQDTAITLVGVIWPVHLP